MYEILLVYEREVSKTRAVYITNLNFVLMERYLSFLVGNGYLRSNSLITRQQLTLSEKGRRLLALLTEVENEVRLFRGPSYKNSR